MSGWGLSPPSTAPLPLPPRNKRSRYRSNRSVLHVPSHVPTQWTRVKVALLLGGTCLMALCTLSPVVLMQRLEATTTTSTTISTITTKRTNGSLDSNPARIPVGLTSLLRTSQEVRDSFQSLRKTASDRLMQFHVPDSIPWQMVSPQDGDTSIQLKDDEEDQSPSLKPQLPDDDKNPSLKPQPHSSSQDESAETLLPPPPPSIESKLSKQKQPNILPNVLPLARGVAGLPMEQTPALVGAQRGHIQCSDVNVDELAYWNDPQGTRDQSFTSPFAKSNHDNGTKRYLTFEPDMGGWNNIRMSMEIIVVLAMSTGRTLVLPPRSPLYLLGMGKENARSFGNFFPFHKLGNHVISMTEFLQSQGQTLLHLSPEELTKLLPVADICIHQADETMSCDLLYSVLRNKGLQPNIEAQSSCLIFDEAVFHAQGVANATATTTNPEVAKRVQRFCGEKRNITYYNHELHDPPLIHWQGEKHEYRLLNHFYAFLYFTNPVIDNYYKRFVRDFLHYKDELYCAAGKIVQALTRDSPHGFSTMHVRRGDFQYKVVKIPAEEWYNNTKEIWNPGEVLFIATDEKNKSWFDPIAEHHPIKFLDDYWDMAGLGQMDSTFLGMIDTIVASQGRVFAGTWFSTFTGYINRMRGYHGMSMNNSWYSFLDRKTSVHGWDYPHGNYPAREWPIGWIGIDGDEVIEHEGEIQALPTVTNLSSATRNVPPLSLADLKQDIGFTSKPMARGIAGRSASETPALVGASRGHIECDVNVDSLAYWNDPQGVADVNFQSPFKVKGDTKYISFSPDRGGWNNVRMSMEIIFVIAAATGRTLVLPPEQNLYLLHHDSSKRHRSFADFFPLHTAEFQKRVPVITMEEFVRREGGSDGRLPIPLETREAVLKAASHCVQRKKADNPCDPIGEYLTSVGHVPSFRAHDYCVVFDQDVYNGDEITPDHSQSVHNFCGSRNTAYWNAEMRDPVLLHIRAGDKQFRLLTHYYGFIHFTDPAMDNYFKRFVRDFLHYHDSIYCAAGKVVKAVQAEGMNRGFAVDQQGGGGFSALHIRRGDFQYKKVKIPAEEWYENTKEIWQPNEILYIATDERNKTWFDPIAKHHTIRFLDDYWDLAGLGDLDPNYMGMIDTIVASRGRAFAGTWFSTFSGYINRMRGHHGMTMMDSWYSFLEKKTAVHEWKEISSFAYAYEWPTGWVGIDADSQPSKDKF